MVLICLNEVYFILRYEKLFNIDIENSITLDNYKKCVQNDIYIKGKLIKYTVTMIT